MKGTTVADFTEDQKMVMEKMADMAIDKALARGLLMTPTMCRAFRDTCGAARCKWWKTLVYVGASSGTTIVVAKLLAEVLGK